MGIHKKKFLRSKKSFEASGFDIIVAIAVVIGFVLIYSVWLKDFRIFGEKLGDYEICKFSNVENAKLKLRMSVKSDYLNLKLGNQVIAERRGNKCKTEYITVPKGDELNIISRKMAGCWDQYLEGKEELFDTEDSNYCAFCSVLEFEDKKQLTGLTDYLVNKEAPGQGGKKYYQYLTRTTVTNDVFREIENAHLKELDIINTEKPQAVIFTTAKVVNPGSPIGVSSTKAATLGSAAGGVLAGVTIVGLGLCTTFTAGICPATILFVGAATGGVSGYMIGSNYNPNLDTKVLLWPYTKEDLSKLQCTKLEGRDNLEIKKS